MTDGARLPCFSAAGDVAGDVEAPAVFAAPPNSRVLHQAMVTQRSNARAGTSSTKTKGEVRGGGKKPYKQKHTGRARQGSTRNPHFAGGGVAFGPKPRKYFLELPDRVRRSAMRSAVSDKARSGLFRVIEAVTIEASKTRHAASLLKKLALDGSVLIVLPGSDESVRRAFRNLPDARVETADSVSAYDVLKFRHLVVARQALEALAARCGPSQVHAPGTPPSVAILEAPHGS